MPCDRIRSTRSGRVSKPSADATSRRRQRNGLDTEAREQGNRLRQPKSEPSEDEDEIAIKALEAELEKLQALKEKNKSLLRRSRHRRRSSQSSSSISEYRTSFKHLDHRAFKTIVSAIRGRFIFVSSEDIEKIYHGTFEARNLHHLANTVDTLEITSFEELIQCIMVYSQIVCHLAQDSNECELQRAFAGFLVRLCQKTKFFTFDSIRNWCFAFMSARIAIGQDRPNDWNGGIEQDRSKVWNEYDWRFQQLLIRKEYIITPSPDCGPSSTAASEPPPICRNFNSKGCTRSVCRYRHICSSCHEGNHSALHCPRIADDSETMAEAYSEMPWLLRE